MQAVRYFIKSLSSRRAVRSELMKGVLLRLTIEKGSRLPGRNGLYAVKMMYRQWLILFALLRRSKANRQQGLNAAFGFGLPDDMVKLYLNTFAHEADVQLLSSGVLKGGPLFYYPGLTFKKAIQITGWLLTWQLAWFSAVFSKRRYETGWTSELFELGLKAILISEPGRKFYFFLSMSPASFLLCYFLSSRLNRDCTFVSSNSPMFRPMRYSYLPDAGLALCSLFQQEEYKLFADKRWQVFKTVKQWGLEEQADLPEQTGNSYDYDLAIYSSGEWARNDSYWREKDLDKIRNYELLEKMPYSLFYNYAFKTALRLKAELNLKVALFPHPYERFLMSAKNIEPPYMKELKEHGIDFCNTGDNSLKQVFRAKAGVASCSTIITDRWHLGLPAYMYSGVNHKAFQVDYDCRYLGSYRRFCFDNEQDLYQKLKREVQN